jgi:hypothetical protein
VLDLNNRRWSELEHAYGAAEDIPPLLARLDAYPSDEGENEPWFSLWSTLAHQGDVYPASFAAVPHVISALAGRANSAVASYFQFPAWVEICRVKAGIEVPEDLAADYFASLATLPTLAVDMQKYEWDEGFAACVTAAIAVSKGQTKLAEAILELTPDVLADFFEWLDER